MFFRTFSSLWLHTEKNTLTKCCLVSLHVFYNCGMTAAYDSRSIDVTFNVFPLGLAFEKKPQEEWPRWLFQKNLCTGSAGQWGLFFPPTSSDLVLPGSCRGVSCWRWQLHRIMTHASCACQTSPDSRVRGSVIHGAVFTALGGMSQAFPVKWSACWTSIFKSSHIFFNISNFSLLGQHPFKCLNVDVCIWVFKIGWNQTLWQCKCNASPPL